MSDDLVTRLRGECTCAPKVDTEWYECVTCEAARWLEHKRGASPKFLTDWEAEIAARQRELDVAYQELSVTKTLLSECRASIDRIQARQCGTCADWREDIPIVPGIRAGICRSETSACSSAYDGSEWPMEWPADHACPSWRTKDAK